MPNRYVRDDVVDKVSGGLRHAPRTAGGAEPAPLAAERQQLVMPALAATKPQEDVGEDAALDKGPALIYCGPR